MASRAIACLLAALLAQPPTTPTSAATLLARGIAEYKGGLLSEAVNTFDSIIATLAATSPADKAQLIQASVYRGAALVGLMKEDAAKASFRQAIDLDPAFRPSRADFPDRVLRVFEAARKGQTKSAMQRPSAAPKKAGIGGVGIGLIVGGAALVAGGAAVAAAGGGEANPPPAPTPSPTPNVNTEVTLVSEQVGSMTVRYVNADPPPGSTITGCGSVSGGCRPLMMVVRLTATRAVRVSQLQAEFNQDGPGTSCLFAGGPGAFELKANEPFDVVLRFDSPLAGRCPIPTNLITLRVSAFVGGEENRAIYRIHYSLQP